MYPLPVPEDVASSGSPIPVKRHHGLVRVAHWLNAIVLVGMIASGLQIYRRFPPLRQQGHAYPLPEPLRSGRSPRLPGLGAAGRLARRRPQLALRAGLALRRSPALLYLGSWSLPANGGRCSSGPRDIGPPSQMQLYYLRLRKEHPPQGKHNALQKGAYTFIVAAGRALGAHRVRDLQAGAARLAHRAVRRLRAGALLALRRGVDLRRLHPAARRRWCSWSTRRRSAR